MIIIYPIVEGHGDERALPALLRNVLHGKFGFYACEILRPYRLPKDKMKKDELVPVVKLGCERLKERLSEGDSGLILCLCDADDDCPVELKGVVEKFVVLNEENIIFEFVAADREYETWFLAARNSFKGHADCTENFPDVVDLLGIRDAKGYFEQNILKAERYYSETVDQVKFSALINFDLHPEEHSRSLQRLLGIFERILPVEN